MVAQRGMAGRPDATDSLAAIAVLTLVLTGPKTRSPARTRGGPGRAIRDARSMQVERAGHLANLEQPEVVNEALLDLLALVGLFVMKRG